MVQPIIHFPEESEGAQDGEQAKLSQAPLMCLTFLRTGSSISCMLPAFSPPSLSHLHQDQEAENVRHLLNNFSNEVLTETATYSVSAKYGYLHTWK